MITRENKEEAVKFHIQVCRRLHTVNLMRWYGHHIHHGVYQDGIFKIIDDLEIMMNARKKAIKKAHVKYPTSGAIETILKETRRKSTTDGNS